MDMAKIIDQYYTAFKTKYADTLLPSQLKALNAICRCRTPDSGELFVQCPDCTHGEWKPLSCGHRSCPKCQNHEASLWIDRQQGKLLPVLYFMTTFTLPYELRSLTWYHQTRVYSIFFTCVASTLKDFGLNSRHLGAQIGMTMVLHTHTRKLDYHPHSEKNIVSNRNGRVTFRYIESSTGKTLYRTLNGEDFLFLIIQHVLPKGFRRVRDFGFLHGNAKKLLTLVQLLLRVIITGVHQRPRPVFKCPCCKTAMIILGFRQFAWESG